MRSRLIVRRGTTFCSRRRTQKQIQIKTQPVVTRGFMRPVFVVCACVLLMSIIYLFTVNARAMQGQMMRDVEQQITQLQKEREQLRIEHAELISLYNIAGRQADLEMISVEQPLYIDVDGPLALK